MRRYICLSKIKLCRDLIPACLSMFYFNMQVYKAKRVAVMKMMDDGFDEKEKERKKQKLKTLAEKGLLKKRSKKRKRVKSTK